MKIRHNYSELDEVPALLEFAAGTIDTKGVEVWIYRGDKSHTQGRTYFSPRSFGMKVEPDTKFLISLWVSIRDIGMSTKGVTFATWQETFLYVAAHEFYHVSMCNIGPEYAFANPDWIEQECDIYAHFKLIEYRLENSNLPLMQEE